MRIFVYRGSLYIAGAPGPGEDKKFADGLWKRASGVARYHQGHRRWRLPLARDVVAGLRDLGLTMPPEVGAWEREQEKLEAQRRHAGALKDMPAAKLRERLLAAGINFYGPPLKDHQITAVAYALRLAACGLFMDTGTGKTAVAATVMQAFADKKGYKRFLVVAPKSILDLGWGRDLTTYSRLSWVNISEPPAREPVLTCPACGHVFKRHVTWAHIQKHMTKYVDKHGRQRAQEALYAKHPELRPPGQEDKRARLLRALSDTRHQVFLINPEAFKLVLEDLCDQDWDMVIVDESSMLKSPRAQITEKMILFAGSINRRVCMTATPRPNTSLDFWGQMAFLDQCLGGDFYRFREQWYYSDYMGYKWLPRAGDTDQQIWSIVEQRAYRVRLEDCVDLPGETTEYMAVDLEGKLLKHYQEMSEQMVTEVDGHMVDTQWPLVQINKLAQITSGYIFDELGEAHYLGDSPKIEATVTMARRLVEDEDRSVVIWVRFPHTEGRCLEELLTDLGVSTLHGGTKDVVASVDAFTSKKNRIMIAHPASAKFGHTWVHCNVAIFHSYDYSWENFYQARRRIYRIGQTKPVTYVVCMARRTIDELIIKRVFEKQDESQQTLDANVFDLIDDLRHQG